MNELIFLEPVFHGKLWGGRHMEAVYGYELPEGPVGECWAISAHPHGDCRVMGGEWDGKYLSALWDEHRELFGNLEGDRFPLLIKILDAQDDLSIQVHPDDAYANEHENGSLGKRECWYILHAREDAQIVVGQHAANRDEFARLVEEGRWDDLLNRVPVHTGDFFQVDPGTVHAILGGTLVLETQESSDVTYRVYDFDRHQPDGSLRELHLAQSLDVIDFAMKAPESGAITAPEVDGVTTLVSTSSYVVDRLVVRPDAPVTYAQSWPFLCASVVEGSGTVRVGDVSYDLPKGTHFVAPAGCADLVFEGDMMLIVSHV
ncbi:MAG: class I mannose-6-phosphate isomerase [Coriobacteriales bacterium]|nr:class I mannose-6-phosphate isomerase [Coriobacteriales bacterium]